MYFMQQNQLFDLKSNAQHKINECNKNKGFKYTIANGPYRIPWHIECLQFYASFLIILDY